MQRVDKRAEISAVAGLVVQGLFFGVFLILFKRNNSAATLANAWFMFAGLGIWLLVWIELYQQRLASQQRQEMESLERERLDRLGGSQSVFQGYSPDEVLPMERRLAMVNRWLVPIGSLLVAGLLTYLAVRLLPSFRPMVWLRDALAGHLEDQQLTLAFAAGAALICFLVSRTTLGLSKVKGWRMVRAGANYMMGNALACFALAIVLAISHYGGDIPERVLGWVIPIVMLVLAAEILLNLLLDAYRPRVLGEEYRPVCESRLLGLLSEPEGVMRSIAHAIDYQFGFKVSDTWFYQLVQNAIVPLLLFGAIVLYLLSCVLIVQPEDRAVVTYYGAEPRVVGSGIHLKWPWPINQAKVYSVSPVRELVLGYTGEGAFGKGAKLDEEGKEKRAFDQDPILWTISHVEGEEFQILVASKPNQPVGEGKSDRSMPVSMTQPEEAKGSAKMLPVNILAGSLIIRYNVKADNEGLLNYVTNYASPANVLEAIAYREWMEYMASVDPVDVMATGREQAAAALRDSIRSEADRHRLGLNVLSVELVGLHPPIKVAPAYEEAINAFQEKESLVWAARGDANQQRPQARAEAVKMEDEAEADRYSRIVIEQARANEFIASLESYLAAPAVYKLRNYLDILVPATEGLRKYVLAIERPERMLIIIDDKEQLPAGMLGLGSKLSEELKKP